MLLLSIKEDSANPFVVTGLFCAHVSLLSPTQHDDTHNNTARLIAMDEFHRMFHFTNRSQKRNHVHSLLFV
ncbi:hypothetical protein BDF19DRAFT_439378 [Syncephalis fuscata]|nr:hypothetical protein BDF19DRAFT_439378 [Syncephalis fuscata]